jgi:hypothetical protein
LLSKLEDKVVGDSHCLVVERSREPTKNLLSDSSGYPQLEVISRT